MKFVKVITLSLVLVPLIGTAQKIKYKDIFPKLNAKSYSVELETQLMIFLEAAKKPHPNANYHLGLIYETRFYKMDILGDTANIALSADSTVNQLSLAITLITEKELKHDEYYQSFHRRDLRTGKYGIKLSDVH